MIPFSTSVLITKQIANDSKKITMDIIEVLVILLYANVNNDNVTRLKYKT